MMSQTEILGKISQLKHNVSHWIDDSKTFLKDKIEHMKEHDEIHPVHIDNYHYESHRIDDSNLTDYHARGIDSFGEDDGVEEGEDRDHSDLSERYYTHGLHEKH